MIIRNNNSNVIGEINTSRTAEGKVITTQTSYLNGQVTVQNVTVRDSQGRVETTNFLGGKILP